MNMTKINKLNYLFTNEYWGRGLLIGHTENRIAAAYFIMGRSENSRNRYFYEENNKIAIAPYDKEKLEDPSLIIYYPVKICGKKLIITNGDQTDTIENALKNGKTFEDGLRTRKFEPDEPHYTPRISGIIDLEDASFKLSILKNDDGEGKVCNRYFYEFDKIPNIARFIHTYEGNATPLPTFEGEPKIFTIPGDIDTFTNDIWNNLHKENKISLFTVMIDPKTGKYESKILNKRMGD